MRADNGIHIPFLWLGMTWDLLLKKFNNKQMGVYVGYPTENISPNFALKLKVTFALVDTDKDNTFSVPPKGKQIYCCKILRAARIESHLGVRNI